ncbi:MAG TPA: SUMF1/EgtB/PvdO family nonheme iron enzyme [Polyangiaceae bacterium]|nr:SUMF1/EgtB/PvdO family nonheme iron enzyme [Polyangiaceae bacterium]
MTLLRWGRRRIKILFLSANALPERPLRVDDELRAITQRLRASRDRDAFELVSCSAVRLEDVQHSLHEHAPDVVHFAGHGEAGAGLVLFDDRGRPAPVRAEALASLFWVFRHEVRLVVFNACFSAEQADAICQSVGLAVGMRGEIADRASIAFAGAFYEALGYGRSVRDAFELGRVAIDALGLSQAPVPRLFAPEGADAAGAFSAPEAASRLSTRMALLTFVSACLAVLALLAPRLRRQPRPPTVDPADTLARCQALVDDWPQSSNREPAAPGPAAPKPRAEQATALYTQAEVYLLKGQLEQAERLHQCVLELRETLLGPLHLETAESLVGLGLFYYKERGDHGRAEPLLLRGLAALEHAFGPTHQRLEPVLNALARISLIKATLAKGDDARVKAELRRAEELTKRTYAIRPRGPNAATLRADALDNLETLAHLYRERGDIERADELDGRARALREAEARPDMIRVAGGTVHLGAFDAASRPAECAALKPDEDCTEATHPERARTLEVLAFSLDTTEVTNDDFAFWLDESRGSWQLGGEDQSIIQTGPSRPLAHAGGACEGGLLIAPPSPDSPARPEPPLADDLRQAEPAPDSPLEPRPARVSVRPGYERRPVVCVTWQGANDYCRAQGKRLPTDAEWELAAKGARGRPFAWGAERPRPEGVAFGGVGYGVTGPRDIATSTRDHTPEGLFDLGGNVAEWTQGSAGANRKVARGGSWASANLCHVLSSGCAFLPPATFASDLGFRCARPDGAKTIGFR